MRPFIPILVLLIGGCKYPHGAIKVQSASLNRFENSNSIVDSNILKTIQPYSDSISGLMNTIVGFSENELTKSKPESLLGNFISDALYECVKLTMLPKEAMCVVLNTGGLRAPLPKGNITMGRVFETLPFENILVLMKITRAQMDSVVQQIVALRGDPVSNLRIHKYKDGTHWELNTGKQPPYIYIITTDYLADGNDGYGVFKHFEKIETGVKLRDAVLLQMQEYKRKNHIIAPTIDGRISFE